MVGVRLPVKCQRPNENKWTVYRSVSEAQRALWPDKNGNRTIIYRAIRKKKRDNLGNMWAHATEAELYTPREQENVSMVSVGTQSTPPRNVSIESVATQSTPLENVSMVSIPNHTEFLSPPDMENMCAKYKKKRNANAKYQKKRNSRRQSAKRRYKAQEIQRGVDKEQTKNPCIQLAHQKQELVEVQATQNTTVANKYQHHEQTLSYTSTKNTPSKYRKKRKNLKQSAKRRYKLQKNQDDEQTKNLRKQLLHVVHQKQELVEVCRNLNSESSSRE